MDLFGDVSELKKHMKDCKLPFKDAIIDYYRMLGERHGFTVLTNSTEIVNSLDYGKIDLVWVEPNIVFIAEFGLLEDIYRHLFKALVVKPSKACLLLSSKSKCSPEKVREIVSKTPELAGIEFTIIDVA
ncbi:MAG: hypothetical protein KKD39_04660 [Candidatus Altiarchaeota archaeon]|nr:hypothetical protein [Candidatus Altiarchaeota archaeon]